MRPSSRGRSRCLVAWEIHPSVSSRIKRRTPPRRVVYPAWPDLVSNRIFGHGHTSCSVRSFRWPGVILADDNRGRRSHGGRTQDQGKDQDDPEGDGCQEGGSQGQGVGRRQGEAQEGGGRSRRRPRPGDRAGGHLLLLPARRRRRPASRAARRPPVPRCSAARGGRPGAGHHGRPEDLARVRRGGRQPLGVRRPGVHQARRPPRLLRRGDLRDRDARRAAPPRSPAGRRGRFMPWPATTRGPSWPTSSNCPSRSARSRTLSTSSPKADSW